ncbi:MAG TPA: LuxR C-terminal-related transcriptional regulator [Propionibacteriaceae bacterium]|nr:LuxR C-terminal-related transcriptional regulator [Propionibacteriaceae bacterium]
MSDVSPRIVDWLCSVMELLREPMTTMPTQKILDRLRACYESTAASWNWRNSDGEIGMIWAPKDIVQSPARNTCTSNAFPDTHPLIGWFGTDQNAPTPTRSPKPTTAVSDDRWLTQLGMECQLRIPYRLDGTTFRTYSVARGGKAYSDDDLTLARHIQQSLITVDRQICVLARLSAEDGRAATATDFQLTGRELAVLQLLAEGRTTRASARRLGCAPRTVEKHLERCFRKLGVSDRLNAVRVATQAGLVAPSQAADSPSQTQPRAARSLESAGHLSTLVR